MRDGEPRLWVLPFALLVLALVAVPLMLLSEDGLPRYRRLKAELITVEAANAALRDEVRALARETHALRTDLGAIERIARDELGMGRPDEFVLEF